MAAKPVEVAKPLLKREPVLVVSAAYTLLTTALYLAPTFGIKLPESAVKVISLGSTIAGAFGIRSLVKPA